MIRKIVVSSVLAAFRVKASSKNINGTRCDEYNHYLEKIKITALSDISKVACDLEDKGNWVVYEPTPTDIIKGRSIKNISDRIANGTLHEIPCLVAKNYKMIHGIEAVRSGVTFKEKLLYRRGYEEGLLEDENKNNKNLKPSWKWKRIFEIKDGKRILSISQKTEANINENYKSLTFLKPGARIIYKVLPQEGLLTTERGYPLCTNAVVLDNRLIWTKSSHSTREEMCIYAKVWPDLRIKYTNEIEFANMWIPLSCITDINVTEAMKITPEQFLAQAQANIDEPKVSKAVTKMEGEDHMPSGLRQIAEKYGITIEKIRNSIHKNRFESVLQAAKNKLAITIEKTLMEMEVTIKKMTGRERGLDKLKNIAHDHDITLDEIRDSVHKKWFESVAIQAAIMEMEKGDKDHRTFRQIAENYGFTLDEVESSVHKDRYNSVLQEVQTNRSDDVVSPAEKTQNEANIAYLELLDLIEELKEAIENSRLNSLKGRDIAGEIKNYEEKLDAYLDKWNIADLKTKRDDIVEKATKQEIRLQTALLGIAMDEEEEEEESEEGEEDDSIIVFDSDVSDERKERAVDQQKFRKAERERKRKAAAEGATSCVPRTIVNATRRRLLHDLQSLCEDEF